MNIKRIMGIAVLVGVIASSGIALASYQVRKRILIQLPATQLDAAGLTYTNAVSASGTVMIEGFYEATVEGTQPTNRETGVTSANIAMWAAHTSPTNGAIIVWKDASKTQESGRIVQ